MTKTKLIYHDDSVTAMAKKVNPFAAFAKKGAKATATEKKKVVKKKKKVKK